jgi:hypothetical protein
VRNVGIFLRSCQLNKSLRIYRKKKRKKEKKIKHKKFTDKIFLAFSIADKGVAVEPD